MSTHLPVDAMTAFLFPGQGGFDGEALRRAKELHPQIGRVFERLDAVTEELYARRLSDVLFGERKADLRDLLDSDPWASQVAIYGAGLAAYEILAARGVTPDVLAGHSLGEITALVAAGAFSVEDGVRIVAQRVAVIERQGGVDGRMVALSASAERTRKLLELVDEPLLAVATENHDEQTVVSGPAGILDRVVAIAGQLGVGAIEIDTPFPFHTPALAPAAPEFAAYVRKLDQHPLNRPVYSPILQRYYEPGDVLADLLAEHFTQPVRFAAAVRHLRETGVGVFVEAGGRAALSKLVAKVTTGSPVRSLPTLALTGGRLALDGTLEELREAGLAAPERGGLAELLAPSVPAEVFAAYWSERGQMVLELVRTELDAFRKSTESRRAEPEPAAETAPAPAPAAPAPASPGSGPRPEAYDRERLFAELRTLYAEALEYPEDVFEDEVQLEAELGVDSVKQVELLSRVSSRYGLPPRESGFRLATYNTMGKITDFVLQQLNDQGAHAAASAAG
ncbi:acyltransferase domain-containing protein [Streptomyces luomodiensis]|uniref:[acyl-carrier-protein] S-malonyltransferase n=1 Tax=Streptomyces luomodiensis TaxID=3026192 RepID=A0ABY9V4T1_9ACTN|nr:acyltransferase domain-containing protein [Streptomyces sp. SCA4-21]WNE99803.1 acyltransferase domain-containing protein [Streptomyces sp. SCA4-21]